MSLLADPGAATHGRAMAALVSIYPARRHLHLSRVGGDDDTARHFSIFDRPCSVGGKGHLAARAALGRGNELPGSGPLALEHEVAGERAGSETLALFDAAFGRDAAGAELDAVGPAASPPLAGVVAKQFVVVGPGGV